MHALKKIQLYWKAKFIQIRGRSAVIIQRHVKIFIKKMNLYRTKLQKIRQNLLKIKLKRALLLYVKKRRADKAKPRTIQ